MFCFLYIKIYIYFFIKWQKVKFVCTYTIQTRNRGRQIGGIFWFRTARGNQPDKRLNSLCIAYPFSTSLIPYMDSIRNNKTRWSRRMLSAYIYIYIGTKLSLQHHYEMRYIFEILFYTMITFLFMKYLPRSCAFSHYYITLDIFTGF